MTRDVVEAAKLPKIAARGRATIGRGGRSGFKALGLL
jgi:hypothetical protein